MLAFLMVVAATVAACDDNPLSEGRDEVSRFRLNPAFANVQVGASVQVTAIPVNSYGEPTGASVTASACDAKVTVAPDTSRTVYEPAERYLVTGVATGDSCLNLSAGGRQATVVMKVLP
jgi:hypothetical protein